MGAYSQGGGGGRASRVIENTGDNLSKPYDIGWPINADTLHQINEMFDALFKSNVKRRSEIAVLETAPVVAGVSVANVQLTSGQVNTLNTIPVELVPAPGVGYYIAPLVWTYEQNIGATAYSGVSAVTLYYNGLTTLPMVGTCTGSNTIGRYMMMTAPVAQTNFGANAHVENLSVVIKAASDCTLGSGTFTAKLWYAKAAIG